MPGAGKLTVVAIVSAAVVVGGWTVWFQHQRSRAVLAFWGPNAARLISAAPDVEIIAQDSKGSLSAAKDIRQARGIQNIRHALIQNETFLWDTLSDRGLTDGNYQLRFREGSRVAIVIFLATSDEVALEGKNERVRLHPAAAKEIKLFCEEQFAESE